MAKSPTDPTFLAFYLHPEYKHHNRLFIRSSREQSHRYANDALDEFMQKTPILTETAEINVFTSHLLRNYIVYRNWDGTCKLILYLSSQQLADQLAKMLLRMLNEDFPNKSCEMATSREFFSLHGKWFITTLGRKQELMKIHTKICCLLPSVFMSLSTPEVSDLLFSKSLVDIFAESPNFSKKYRYAVLERIIDILGNTNEELHQIIQKDDWAKLLVLQDQWMIFRLLRLKGINYASNSLKYYAVIYLTDSRCLKHYKMSHELVWELFRGKAISLAPITLTSSPHRVVNLLPSNTLSVEPQIREAFDFLWCKMFLLMKYIFPEITPPEYFHKNIFQIMDLPEEVLYTIFGKLVNE